MRAALRECLPWRLDALGCVNTQRRTWLATPCTDAGFSHLRALAHVRILETTMSLLRRIRNVRDNGAHSLRQGLGDVVGW